MKYPMFTEVTKSREILAAFGGYNHTLSAQEGEFYDMKNMTSAHYPVLSPREPRGFCRQMINPQGILDKEVLMWIDNGKLYVDGEETALDGIELSNEADMSPKVMAKMGAYVVIMPDKVWYNVDDGTCGYLESSFEVASGTKVSFSLCESDGTAITWHDDAYYDENEPEDGDYMMSENSTGKTSLKRWSETTSMWVVVTSVYVVIESVGIGSAFEEGDGIEITIDNSAANWEYAPNIFVNDEGDGKYSINTTISKKTDDTITIVGLLNDNVSFTNLPVTVARSVPDMAFITECNNRLWGCSKDGHEVYCCKLGDVKNWNAFQGISTDSWAATVGSDGKFTGAITYGGYPIFFKEDSLLKIAVSSTGGHQYKETPCRGVQRGSEKSLCILNEVLFFKSTSCICAYTGSVPYSVSEVLGEVRYYDAVAGTIGNRYYISMRDGDGEYTLFCYDSAKSLWHKEDDVNPLYFCRNGDELYYIDSKDKMLKSIRGTLPYDVPEATMEDEVPWMVQSGVVGYEMPDNKYVSRICIRLSMEFGSSVDFYIQYNSSGRWEHKFNMCGTGTRTYLIPIIPRRCDHFSYKLVGRGACKIYSITKTIEEGSDLR